MKKKLFALLTLLLCVCSGAWADELFTLNSSTTTTDATFPVGSALEEYTYSSSGYWASGSNDCISIVKGGSFTFTNVNGVTITGITIKGCAQNNSAKNSTITITDNATTPHSVTAARTGSDDKWTGQKVTEPTTVGISSGISSLQMTAGTVYTVSNGSTNSDYALGIIIEITYTTSGGGGETPTSYSVTHTLSNVTKTVGDDTARESTEYTAEYSANSGYSLPSTIGVTIGGKAATAVTDYTWNSSTGAFQVPAAKVIGNIVVTIAGVEEEKTTTIFSMKSVTGPMTSMSQGETKDVTATFVGGSAQVYQNASSGVMVDANGVNLAGSGSSYIHISLSPNHMLQAGDVITFSTIEPKNTIYISTSTGKGEPKTLTRVGETYSYTYTLGTSDLLIGASELYIFKNGLRYVKEITITGTGAFSDFALSSSDNVTVAPEATSQIEYASSSTGAITYTSSNTSVAEVSSTGLITGKALGTATITVKQDPDVSYRIGGTKITVNVQKVTEHTGEWILDTENGSRSSNTYTTTDGSLKFILGSSNNGSNTTNDLKNTHFKHSGDISFTLPSNYAVSSLWFVGYGNGEGDVTVKLQNVDGEALASAISKTIGGNTAVPTADCANFQLASPASKSLTLNISGESRGYFILNPAAQNITLTQVGSNYYASYYSVGETTITGATAYTATLDAENSKVVLTECANGVVGGRTGVILIGNSASATATPSFTGAEKGQGDLIGAGQKQVAMANYYASGTSAADKVFVLGVENGKAGLYKYTGTSLGVNKAYLYNETLISARALTFGFDNETTAINGVNVETVKKELKKYFENGQIVIEKDGMKYNAAGQQIK